MVLDVAKTKKTVAINILAYVIAKRSFTPLFLCLWQALISIDFLPLFLPVMKTNSVRLLRTVGLIEGISLLVLLCIAMPLKYVWHIPEAVKVVGWVHGVLFVLFMAVAFRVYEQRDWP